MTSPSIRIAILALALSFATTAQAQWDDWYIAPSVIYFDDDGDRNLDDGMYFGQFSVGRGLTRNLAIEGLLGYYDVSGYKDTTISIPDQKHTELGVNLLAFLDRDATVAPYLLVGIGQLRTKDSIGNTENRPSASFGVGLNWNIAQSNFSLRAELRSRLAYEKNYNFIDNIASLGVQYSFGAKSSARSLPQDNVDTDGDGVLDMWDECPDTPRGTEVTSRGCELKNIDRDSDGDRVFDSVDQCPNTPRGVPVDPVGCSLDSDRDGVTTDRDRCPASAPGAIVDSYGCSRDGDGDGVLNPTDRCPETRPGATVDVNGCEFTDVIQLPGVNFGSSSDLLLPGTERIIESAAATLNNHPDLQIEVAGHTDSDGDANMNYGLSERRAKTVRDFLIRYGVDGTRLTVRGYGESQPIDENETMRGRATNRRVELRIVDR